LRLTAEPQTLRYRVMTTRDVEFIVEAQRNAWFPVVHPRLGGTVKPVHRARA
jgi:hypothetical protein